MKEKTFDEGSFSNFFSKKSKDSGSSVNLANPSSNELTKGQTLCGDLNIRIDSDGLWFYHGSPIGRKELVRLFASVLSIDNEGRYWLTTPAERGQIIVEDVPFMAVEMTVRGKNEDSILRFRTNVDDEITADSTHPIRVEINPETKEPSPYIMVRDGLEARLTRAVFYQMVDLGIEMTVEMKKEECIYKEQIFGVWSSGQFFQIGNLTK